MSSETESSSPKSTLDILKELSTQDSEQESNTEPEVKSSEEPVKSPELKEPSEPNAESEEKTIEVKRKPGRPKKIQEPEKVPEKPPTPEQILDPIIPPRSMSKEELEDFKKLSRPQQEYLSRRERERERGVQAYIQKLAHENRQVDVYRKALLPHEPIMKMYNVEPAEFVSRMVEWDKGMRVDPINVGRQFLEVYGLTPEHLMGMQQQQRGGQQAPMQQQRFGPTPEIAALQQELSEVRSIFATQKQQQEEERLLQITQTVDQIRQQWCDQKDADGILLHPYIEEIEGKMAKHIEYLRGANPKWNIETILDRAYMLALEDAPEIKGAITERQQAIQKRKQIAEEQKRAAEMKRSSVSIGPQNGAKMRTDVTTRDTRSILRGLAAGEIEPL